MNISDVDIWNARQNVDLVAYEKLCEASENYLKRVQRSNVIV